MNSFLSDNGEEVILSRDMAFNKDFDKIYKFYQKYGRINKLNKHYEIKNVKDIENLHKRQLMAILYNIFFSMRDKFESDELRSIAIEDTTFYLTPKNGFYYTKYLFDKEISYVPNIVNDII